MEADQAGSILILLGVLVYIADLVWGGPFWSRFVYIGLSWFIAGFVYSLMEREVTIVGFSAAFLLGIVGAVLWLVINGSREQSRRVPSTTYYPKVCSGRYYYCGSCEWFGHPHCDRKEQFAEAEKCKDFSFLFPPLEPPLD